MNGLYGLNKGDYRAPRQTQSFYTLNLCTTKEVGKCFFLLM